MSIFKKKQMSEDSFKAELQKKNYYLSIELLETFKKSVLEFSDSEALTKFVSKVEDVEKVGEYFPSDNSIKRFKNKIRKDYKHQIVIVLKYLEENLLTVYANKYKVSLESSNFEKLENGVVLLPGESRSCSSITRRNPRRNE